MFYNKSELELLNPMQKNPIKPVLKIVLYLLTALILILLGRVIGQYFLLKPPESESTMVENTRPAEEYFFVQSFKDLPEEVELAKDEGKTGVFVFFEMQGCPYCDYMKEHVLNRIDVQKYYASNFRNITIDIHAQTEAVDVDGTEMTEALFSKLHQVDLTPTLVFFGVDGEELQRKQGMIKDPNEFIALAKEVVEFSTP